VNQRRAATFSARFQGFVSMSFGRGFNSTRACVRKTGRAVAAKGFPPGGKSAKKDDRTQV
jgi:hypothetical protein